MADGTIELRTEVQLEAKNALDEAKKLRKEMEKTFDFDTSDNSIKQIIKDLKVLAKNTDSIESKLKGLDKQVPTESWTNLSNAIAEADKEVERYTKLVKNPAHKKSSEENLDLWKQQAYVLRMSQKSLEARGKSTQHGYETVGAKNLYNQLVANNQQMNGYIGLINQSIEAEKVATAEAERQKNVQKEQQDILKDFEGSTTNTSEDIKQTSDALQEEEKVWEKLGLTVEDVKKKIKQYQIMLLNPKHKSSTEDTLAYWKQMLADMEEEARAKREAITKQLSISEPTINDGSENNSKSNNGIEYIRSQLHKLSEEFQQTDAVIYKVVEIANNIKTAQSVEEINALRNSYEQLIAEFGGAGDFSSVGDKLFALNRAFEAIKGSAILYANEMEMDEAATSSFLYQIDKFGAPIRGMASALYKAKRLITGIGEVNLDTIVADIKRLAEKVANLKKQLDDPNNTSEHAFEAWGSAAKELEQLTNVYEMLGGKVEDLHLFPEDADAQAEQAEQAITKVADKAKDEGNQTVKELVGELNYLESKLVELQEQGLGPGDKVYDDTITRISEIKDKLKEWRKIQRDIGSEGKTVAEAYLDAPKRIQELARRFDELRLKQQGAGLSLGEKFEMGVINRKLRAYDRSLEENVVAEKESAKATNTNSSAKKKAEAITDKLASAHKRLDKTTNNLKKSFKKGLVFISKYFLGFRSLFFLVRKLRTSVKEGLQNLVQFKGGANETNKAITELQTSILFIKNAWAAAFAPVINYVMPVLTMLMDMFAKLGNAIGRFFATLTGQKTVIQAVKADVGSYADTLNGTAGSAGKAADATDKLNDRLAAFDDLNVLGVDKDDDNKGTGGGGGGKGDNLPNVDEMFTEVVPTSSLADKIKEAFLSGDFTDLGSALSEKIRTGLENIDWEPIKTAAEKIGKGVATFINGFFDPTTFSAIGSTIAETLNTVTTAVNSFFANVDVSNIAESTTSLLAGFLETTDFSALGTTASNIVSALLNYVSTFITTFPYDGVVQALISFFSGIKWADVFTGAGKLVGSIAVGVSELANAITEPLAELIVDNFTDNGELSWKSFKDGLKNAITGIASWLNENVFYPFAEGFCEAFGLDGSESSFFTDGIDLIAGFLDGIIDAMKSIGSWIKKHIFDPVVDNVKELFGINSPSTVFKEFGGYLIEGLVNGIRNGFAAIRNVIKVLRSIITSAFETIKDKVVAVWQKVYDAVAPIINALFGVVASVYDVVRSAVNFIIDAINTLHWEIPDWVPFVGGKEFGFDIPKLPELELPELAKGAVIPPNKEFLAVLGDQKQGTNIEAPLDTIVDAFRQVVGNINVQNTGNQVLQVDGQTFARLMTPYVVSELGRRGYNVKLLEG